MKNSDSELILRLVALGLSANKLDNYRNDPKHPQIVDGTMKKDVQFQPTPNQVGMFIAGRWQRFS